MRRHPPKRCCFVLGVIALVAACSGPTHPTDASNKASSTATTSQPAAAPKGNVLFVSASPAPGANVIIGAATPTEAPSLTLSFSATFDSDLANVAMQVQLLDANQRVCASGTSPQNSVAANATVTFTVTGVSIACPLPLATVTAQASLIPAAGGNAYGKASVPVQYAFTLGTTAPPQTSKPDGISLVSASPTSGSEFVVTDSTAVGLSLPNFQAAFGVVYKDALADGKLEVELLDGSGAQCWYGFFDHAVPAGSDETIPVSGANGMLVGAFQNGSCGTFPEHLTSVRATLLTLRGPEVNGHLTRTDYLTQTFPLAYTINRYPPVPPNAPATAPTVTAVNWYNFATPSDPIPVPGDNISAGCTVTEADGAAMTVTLTVAFDGIAPLKWTGTTPVAASSSPLGARFGITFSVPTTLKFPPPIHAKVTCDATNPRGETASKSIDIGTPQ